MTAGGLAVPLRRGALADMLAQLVTFKTTGRHHMRWSMVAAACALCSFGFVSSADASPLGPGAYRSAKVRPDTSGKPKIYEWCGSKSGCGYHPEIWFKSKEWGEYGKVIGPVSKGKKGEIILGEMTVDGECHVDLYKVHGTKNYSGEEPPGQYESCYVQTITLTYES